MTFFIAVDGDMMAHPFSRHTQKATDLRRPLVAPYGGGAGARLGTEAIVGIFIITSKADSCSGGNGHANDFNSRG